eukprot:CAMPEP_0170566894 /NCGR_PEP_ID=MMETSP0211-20121228/80134_1 /TAXON_ID=311385 /ORGANISM="Pseudokeronopsis sp., Strain OXSARD2" /LENGTH=134 /DNA_ID=CAMNT_0010888199 /DNA_START=2765 /DNA_END=3169 /DNA_ORIENTATION=-
MNAYDALMKNVMVSQNHLMEKNNQKINYERERSREKLKLRQSQNNSRHQYDNSIDNSKSLKDIMREVPVVMIGFKSSQIKQRDGRVVGNGLSIRKVPELVARLNKSPSSNNLRYMKGLESFGSQGSYYGAAYTN